MMKFIGLKMKEGTIALIDRYAKAENRDRSKMITQLIEEALEMRMAKIKAAAGGK